MVVMLTTYWLVGVVGMCPAAATAAELMLRVVVGPAVHHRLVMHGLSSVPERHAATASATCNHHLRVA